MYAADRQQVRAMTPPFWWEHREQRDKGIRVCNHRRPRPEPSNARPHCRVVGAGDLDRRGSHRLRRSVGCFRRDEFGRDRQRQEPYRCNRQYREHRRGVSFCVRRGCLVHVLHLAGWCRYWNRINPVPAYRVASNGRTSQRPSLRGDLPVFDSESRQHFGHDPLQLLGQARWWADCFDRGGCDHPEFHGEPAVLQRLRHSLRRFTPSTTCPHFPSRAHGRQPGGTSGSPTGSASPDAWAPRRGGTPTRSQTSASKAAPGA
jgi:hypothetical protein